MTDVALPENMLVLAVAWWLNNDILLLKGFHEMATKTDIYPADLNIDYPPKLDRVTTFFRFIWALPIMIILVLLTATGGDNGTMHEASKEMAENGTGIIGGLFAATALLIIFRQRYPRWWFDFALELNRFAMRVSAYLLFLTDRYPSTVEQQSVHLDIVYPDAKQGLNRWLPLVKWLLAIPHYILLLVLTLMALAAALVSWFAILFTGRYPKDLFAFIVGVMRWNLRVSAYAVLLTTDQYPPFSLK